MSEMLERRASKFLNRALPEPPTEQQRRKQSADADDAAGEETLDNLYELVSQSEKERTTYEDIDIVSNGTADDVSAGSKASSTASSSSHKSPSRWQQGVGPSSAKTVVDTSPLDYYLEPVSKTAEIGGGPSVDPVEDGRPRPAPRGVYFPRETTEKGALQCHQAVAAYSNTKKNKQFGANMTDSFGVIAALNLDTLRHLGERLYGGYVQGALEAGEAEWGEFSWTSEEPVVRLDDVVFYRAVHPRLASQGCTLVVCIIKFKCGIF